MITLSQVLNQQQSERARALSILSPRHIEVVRLYASGRSTKEIAADLNISVKTVESHRVAIYARTECRNIADLTRFAVRYGLITVEVAA